MKNFTSVLVTYLLINTACFSQPGTLDSTFGGDGRVITDFGAPAAGNSVAIQADGKIVVAGASFPSGNGDFAITRYRVNGELDSTFGVNGKVITDLNNVSDDKGYSVNILTDQKILVGGISDYKFAMVRYMPGGIIDSTFGVNGKVITKWQASNKPIVILPDGKIMIGGYWYRGYPKSACFLVRYNSNGTTDSSFGVDGFGDTMYLKDAFYNTCITLQNDGKIVMGGTAGVTDGDGSYFVVLRFNPDGTIDNGFGTNGRATAFSIGNWAHVHDVAIQTDGKVIEAGDAYGYPSREDFALARYIPNGRLDSSFGRYGGKEVTYFYQTSYDNISSIAIQPDGKIIAAGVSSGDFALARYTANGHLDSSFGINGKVVTDFANGGGDAGYSVCLQTDGKIIVAGQSNNDFAIARYNNDEALPVSIIDLKAYLINSNVKIEWTALNQLNISQYNIERSVDGKNFITLGNVKAQDNGQQKIDYSYIDQVPAGGDNFYRIKSVSKDGVTKYTNTVKVHIVNNESLVAISPNPVGDILHITGLSSSSKTISIIDVKGKLLQQVTTSNSNYTINVKQLAAGIYFIRIAEGDKISTMKFIKE